ncbi:hypothetical protein BDR22DRAFT_895485 [Usnea florida]
MKLLALLASFVVLATAAPAREHQTTLTPQRSHGHGRGFNIKIDVLVDPNTATCAKIGEPCEDSGDCCTFVCDVDASTGENPHCVG